MTQNDLREKVINAEAKVAKRKAVLKKHREQLAKLIQKGADEFDISIKKDDIESAKRKLEEAEKILNNWKEKLDERITADDYLEANAPEILKDFLENWKQHAIAYYRQRRIDVIEFRKDLKAQERAARLEALQTLPSLERARKLYEGREVTDYDLANLWPRKDVDEFLHERGLDYYQIQKKLKGEGDGVTFRLLEIHGRAGARDVARAGDGGGKAGQAARPDRPHHEHRRHNYRRGCSPHRPRGRHQRIHRRHRRKGEDPDHRRRRLQHPVFPLQNADP